MKKIQFPELQTDRLVLRRLIESDWKEIQYLRSDKKVNKFVKRPKADTREKALAFIQRINTEIETRNSVYWSISLKNKQPMIGSISLWNFSEDKKTAEVGYDLNPQFHKMGIMNEALQAVLNYGFQELNLDKIEAFTQINNEPSRQLLKKNKFKLNESRFDEDNPENLIFEIYRR